MMWQDSMEKKTSLLNLCSLYTSRNMSKLNLLFTWNQFRLFEFLQVLISHSLKLKIYFDLHFYLKEHYEKYSVKKILEKNEQKRKQKSRTFISLWTNIIEVILDSILMVFVILMGVVEYSKSTALVNINKFPV